MLRVGEDLPVVEICYSGLCVSTSKGRCSQPTEDDMPPSVPRYFWRLVAYPLQCAAAWLRRKPAPPGLAILHNLTGCIRPGTATIILSAPGGGSSTLLRVLCGREPATAGVITWNGRTATELAQDGVVLRKLASYCPESDDHEFLLTVHETFDFAYSTAVVPPGVLSQSLTNASARGNGPSAVENSVSANASSVPSTSTTDGNHECWTPPDAAGMTRAMGLTEARDTIIGNNLIRGVSGGQKRRVTVGETLILNSRIVTLDGPTNGLDAVTANQVMKYTVDWAHKTNGIVVATLQQPLPETFSLFDEVILLAEGRVLYHGAVAQLDGYLASLGFVRPSYMDSAAWAVEIVSNPLAAATLLLEDCRKQHAHDIVAGARVFDECRRRMPSILTVAAMADEWERRMNHVRKPAAEQREQHVAEPIEVNRPPAPSAGTVASAGTLASASSEAAQVRVHGSPHVVDAENLGVRKPPLPGVQLRSAYARKQYGSLHTAGFRAQLALTTTRELVLAKRNWLYSSARLVNAVLMGVILGTVYISLNAAEFFLFFSVSLFAVTFVSFLNNSIVPIAMASRSVAYKHTAAGLYSENSYNLAVLIGHLPISMIADLLFATILYWIVGYAANAGRWAFFVLVVFLMDLAISVMYRSFSYAAGSQELAMIVSSLFTAVGLSTGGYFVVRNQVPAFLIWLLYISPFFWSVDSIANNEFLDPKYQVPFDASTPQGKAFMSTFAFLYGTGWKWFGAGILLLYYLVFGLLVQPLLLRYVRYDVSPGTKRLPITEDEEDISNDTRELEAATNAAHAILAEQTSQSWTDTSGAHPSSDAPLAITPPATVPTAVTLDHGLAAAPAVVVAVATVNHGTAGQSAVTSPQQFLSSGPTPPLGGPVRSEQRSQGSVRNSAVVDLGSAVQIANESSRVNIPAVTLTFQNVSYFVPGATRGAEKQLLRNVSGFALPGTLTALCGASGAGKTTLLDVLAFRKTTGRVQGSIRLNGTDATAAMFARASCFAEQADEHLPTTSVREALLFSAALRTSEHDLPPGARRAVVDDILQTLEMTRLAERRVSTLSRGELKRLSLGVELASLSGLVFCDEPTTGLSARAASIVVRCLQRIAQRGRTVICTIHQPSAHLFFAFTHLLLLAPGGHQVYFGPLGEHAEDMVRYFETVPGVAKLPPYTNPATWMLDVLDSTFVTPAEQREARGTDGVSEGTAHNATVAPMDASSVQGLNTTDQPAVVVTGNQVPVTGTAGVDGAGNMAIGSAPAVPVDLPAEGFPAPRDSEIVEITADTQKPVKRTGEDFARAYAASPLFARMLAELERNAGTGSASKPVVGSTQPGTVVPTTVAAVDSQPSGKQGLASPQTVESPYATGWGVQLRYVLDRALRDSWRNSEYTANRILAICFLAVFFGLLYLELDKATFQGVQSALGAVLAGMGFCGVLVFTIGVPLYMRYRASVYRERDARFYRITVHALSLLVVETLWVALLSLLFVAIFYYLIKFDPSFDNFLFYLLGTFICVLCFMYAALCAAAMFPTSIVAQLAGGVFLSVVFLFAGIFVPRPNCPRGWAWFMYADFAFHLVRAMATNEFFCAGGPDVCPSITLVTPAGPQTVTTYAFVSSNLGAGFGERWAGMGIAALILCGFVLATLVMWKVFNHQKR